MQALPKMGQLLVRGLLQAVPLDQHRRASRHPTQLFRNASLDGAITLGSSLEQLGNLLCSMSTTS